MSKTNEIENIEYLLNHYDKCFKDHQHKLLPYNKKCYETEQLQSTIMSVAEVIPLFKNEDASATLGLPEPVVLYLGLNTYLACKEEFEDFENCKAVHDLMSHVADFCYCLEIDLASMMEELEKEAEAKFGN